MLCMNCSTGIPPSIRLGLIWDAHPLGRMPALRGCGDVGTRFRTYPYFSPVCILLSAIFFSTVSTCSRRTSSRSCAPEAKNGRVAIFVYWCGPQRDGARRGRAKSQQGFMCDHWYSTCRLALWYEVGTILMSSQFEYYLRRTT